MNEINYENEYGKIDQESINENIPRDLRMLYNVQPYNSQRNPSTQHQELFYNDRRSKLYDYGKAIYRVISAAEAIQMVKNNKEDVQNLRIIFAGSLVEYEVRDNGTIYAIYRDSNAIDLNDKTYKNIGYAPWRQVIEAADKIYWTDEYSKKLSTAEIEKRNAKKATKVIYKGLTPTDIGYDEHKPYNNLMGGKVIRSAEIPDTGRHSDTNKST